MFTGIIRNTGTIEKVLGDKNLKKIIITSPEDFVSGKKTGDSVCVDGACLTIKKIEGLNLEFDIMPESLKKTIIDSYVPGQSVNLEASLKIGDTLDGHFVNGHVDFTAPVIKIEKNGDTMEMEIGLDEGFTKFIALKGSVTVNGVSLTVSRLERNSFSVCIIPETIKNTNFHVLKEGAMVNIEIDLFVRYLNSLLEQKEKQISYDFLKERGFI